ncbi:Leucine dehydrogenase [Labilithrix luteola]|uniref:Leucine dehydrogenase n=2 Tax=Labilithrix luteola TaxID=1391654 RepID=A0A0K1PVI1_9BACT|nr:Leucine dehydrogenase [Labilithrix luteola]
MSHEHSDATSQSPDRDRQGALAHATRSKAMHLFGHLKAYDYGEVHFKFDKASGLKAIIAIHDSRLGPALGGCRFIDYVNDEAALIDALRLARGMTYKAALAGLAHGGGKSVIVRPKERFDRVALFRAFGKFVDDLGGHYITAEDSGTGLEDMEVIRTVTKSVTGVDVANGGSGDPSPFTALGVRRGIEACVKFKLGRDSLAGVHVAVQGVGHVGYHLCKELHAVGATISVADVDPLKTERAQREFGASVVPLDSIFEVDCDVLAPCALGSALNDTTIPRLRATIVAGAANNQLAEPRHGDDLYARDILYAPDYAINAGGLVNVAQEVLGYDAKKAREKTMTIYDTIYEIADRSRKTDAPTYKIADMMVEEKLALVAEGRS